VETFQSIWEELGSRVRRFVGKRVNDPAAADDLTQDVLLKVRGQLGDPPPDEKLPAWVFAVARNAVIDHYRSRAVRDHADLADVDLADDQAEDEQQQALRDLSPCLTRMSVIACKLDSAALGGRAELLAGLVARASGRVETDDGYVLRFPPDGVGLAELAGIVEPERRCCPFLRIVLTADPNGGPISLELGGPKGTKTFLRGLLGLG
jgi:RNA polymerase sigma factor (sigma-70 family)